MNKLYKFYYDCGRMGEIEGIFVSSPEEIEKAIGQEIYFGEILGKHSEVFLTLEEDDLTVLTDDQDFITQFLKFGAQSGYNPLDYLDEDE